MIPSSINLAIVFIIDIITLWWGLWVYFSNRKAKANKAFLGMAFFVFLWMTFSFLFSVAKQEEQIILWLRLNFGAVALSALFAYFFILYFPYEGKRYPILDVVVSLTWILLFFLSVFSSLIIKGIRFEEWGTDIVFGRFGVAFLLMSAITLFIIIAQLLKKYFTMPKEGKLKIQYFLVGSFLFVAFNILFNVIAPIILKNSKFYHFGDYSAIFLIGFTAYAIVKQELFGIRVVLTQVLVGLIAILLLAQAITATGWIDFSWKFGVFLIFLYFGYLLIQSVIREIQRRAELQKLYEEVDKLSRAKSEFLSIASHQLRTPLTAIKGYISMMLEGSYGKFEEKGKPPLEKVYQSNERLIRLVNDLLNVSRIESGTIMTDFQKTSIENMISSIIDELKIKSDERKLYLNWQKPGQPLPEVMADTNKLRQVIMNIIDNAIKYTEKGGITIRAKSKDPSAEWPQGKVLIEIKDTGEGMEKEEIDKMFGSFIRGRAGAKHWVSGLGLGLYIAKKFTELHGGKIWVESEGEGKGSTFYIELPVK